MFNLSYAPMVIFPGRLGSTEILAIFAIVLLLFGPKYLPRLGQSIGKTCTGFKEGLADAQDEKDQIVEKKESDAEEI